MRWQRHLSALRGFAVAGMACALVVACRGGGGIGTNGVVPAGLRADSVLKKRKPDVVRIVPFEKSRKLGVSAGQPVYALFTSKQLPLVSSTTDISVYGALPVSGQAGPLGQIATVTGPKSGQHLYVDAKGRLFEITDRTSNTLMLMSYPREKNPAVFEARTVVCQSGREVGTIIETTRKGVTSTVVAKRAGECPKSLTGAVAFAASSEIIRDATPHSKVNIAFYSCLMGSTLFSSASDRFYAAARLAKHLQGLGDTYGQMGALFGDLCNNNSLIVVQRAQTPPACTMAAENQPVCAYQPPPVAITARPAACPSSTTVVIFNAPGQTCSASIPYSVGTSNARYKISSSNASTVAVKPTSGTVTGSGKLSFTMTAGSAGGAAIVTATITNNGNPQKTSFDVSNAWTSSASNAIAAIAFALPSGTLPLGQTMTFAIGAQTAAGVTISGAYDHPITLSGTNLVVSPSQLTNSAQAQQITASWKSGFAGTGKGTIEASADGQTASVQIRPGTGSQTFNYTGAEENFIVPAGVTQVTIMAIGAGNASAPGGGYYGGSGASVTATIPVTPGEVLAVFVGGMGTLGKIGGDGGGSPGGAGGLGGFNGGGAGGAGGSAVESCSFNCSGFGGNGGAGASDVREGGGALGNRVIVAGGGGGSGRAGLTGDQGNGSGGAGGELGSPGGPGVKGCDGSGNYGVGGGPGSGGTQSRGGAAGVGGSTSGGAEAGGTGSRGAFSIGGSGGVAGSGPAPSSSNGGSGGDGGNGAGGGGGGYFGGGGGGGGPGGSIDGPGCGGGGGGGSSYVEPGAIKATYASSSQNADGQIVISW